ncbi:hypothetical protein D3C85_1108280 [compost metagenome]
MKFHVKPPSILACADFEGVGLPSRQWANQRRALQQDLAAQLQAGLTGQAAMAIEEARQHPLQYDR